MFFVAIFKMPGKIRGLLLIDLSCTIVHHRAALHRGCSTKWQPSVLARCSIYPTEYMGHKELSFAIGYLFNYFPVLKTGSTRLLQIFIVRFQSEQQKVLSPASSRK